MRRRPEPDPDQFDELMEFIRQEVPFFGKTMN